MDTKGAMPTMAHDFSPMALFLQSDIVVKAVMVLLVVASIIVWAIIIDRTIRIVRLRHQARLLRANTLAGTSGGGLARSVLTAGQDAARTVLADETRVERRERVREAMRLTLADGVRGVEPGLPFLATVGSTAPFIGLFGTVWGIMTSFADIAAKSDTSLAVVAPGIAEALFSTAIGLVAAIPAVVAYNKLAGSLARSRAIAIAAIAVMSDRMTHAQPAAAE